MISFSLTLIFGSFHLTCAVSVMTDLGCLSSPESPDRCFEIVSTDAGITWLDAWDECLARGGLRLAHMETLDIYSELKTRLVNSGFDQSCISPCVSKCWYVVGIKGISGDVNSYAWVPTRDATPTQGTPINTLWPNFTSYIIALNHGTAETLWLYLGSNPSYFFEFDDMYLTTPACGYICEHHTIKGKVGGGFLCPVQMGSKIDEMEHALVDTKSAAHIQACVHRCHQNRFCTTIDFNKADGTCHLFATNPYQNNISVIPQQGTEAWQYI